MGRFVQIFFVVTTIAVSVAVYALKYDTGRDAVVIADLKRQIAVEKSALSVLTAEWSLLNQPDRLQRLASKFLDLKPLEPARSGSLAQIQIRPDEDRLDALVLQALNPATEITTAFAPAPLPRKKP